MYKGHKRKAHFEGTRYLIEPLLASHDWQIRALWADATALQEAEGNWPDHHPAARGLVYQLGPKDPHEVLRCHKSIRPVFPADNTHPDGPYALPLDALELKGLHYTSRALLFDFGQAWLEVSLIFITILHDPYTQKLLKVNFLLHTLIQLFSKEVWINSICKMEKSVSLKHCDCQIPCV